MKEEIIIVDEEDNEIGSELRELVDKKRLIYRVSALWIFNSKKESLFARRSYTKTHYPGKWGPAVAGTVSKGETYEENIIKEAEEELGLTNLKIKKGLKTKTDSKFEHFTQWFMCSIDTPIDKIKIQEDEVVEIKWFSKEEIMKILKDNPDECLPKLSRYVEMFYQ